MELPRQVRSANRVWERGKLSDRASADNAGYLALSFCAPIGGGLRVARAVEGVGGAGHGLRSEGRIIKEDGEGREHPRGLGIAFCAAKDGLAEQHPRGGAVRALPVHWRSAWLPSAVASFADSGSPAPSSARPRASSTDGRVLRSGLQRAILFIARHGGDPFLSMALDFAELPPRAGEEIARIGMPRDARVEILRLVPPACLPRGLGQPIEKRGGQARGEDCVCGSAGSGNRFVFLQVRNRLVVSPSTRTRRGRAVASRAAPRSSASHVRALSSSGSAHRRSRGFLKRELPTEKAAIARRGLCGIFILKKHLAK